MIHIKSITCIITALISTISFISCSDGELPEIIDATESQNKYGTNLSGKKLEFVGTWDFFAKGLVWDTKFQMSLFPDGTGAIATSSSYESTSEFELFKWNYNYDNNILSTTYKTYIFSHIDFSKSTWTGIYSDQRFSVTEAYDSEKNFCNAYIRAHEWKQWETSTIAKFINSSNWEITSVICCDKNIKIKWGADPHWTAASNTEEYNGFGTMEVKNPWSKRPLLVVIGDYPKYNITSGTYDISK